MVFGNKSVNDVLTKFNDMVDELHKIAERESDLALSKRKRINELNQEAFESETEASRAMRVASRIEDFVNA